MTIKLQNRLFAGFLIFFMYLGLPSAAPMKCIDFLKHERALNQDPVGSEAVVLVEPTQVYIDHLKVNEYTNFKGGAKEKDRSVLILVHGGPGLGGYLGGLAQILSSQYKVAEYFQRDTPASATTGEISVDSHIADLGKVVDHYAKPEQTPIVIGHSWGGLLSLAFASAHPNKVKKYLILNAMPFDSLTSRMFSFNLRNRISDETKAKLFDIMREKSKYADDDERLSELSLEEAVLMSPYYNADPTSVGDLGVSSFSKVLSEMSFESYHQALEQNRFMNGFQTISDPVIAFHGELDPIPHERTLPVLSEHIEGIQTHLFEDAGHFLWLETSVKEQFMSLLLKALEN